LQGRFEANVSGQGGPNSSPALKCEFCIEEFRNFSSYVSHQWSHTNKGLFSCPLCQKVFSDVSQLVFHSSSHSPDFCCPSCPATFISEVDLDSHIKSSHRPQACGICDLSFPSKHAKEEHQKRDHSLCHICGEAFGKELFLKRHIFVAHGIQVASVPKNSMQTGALNFSYVPQSTNSEIQTIDLDTEMESTNEVRIMEESEEFPEFHVMEVSDDYQILEVRSKSPVMPVIVDTSSYTAEPQPQATQPQDDYRIVDIDQLIYQS